MLSWFYKKEPKSSDPIPQTDLRNNVAEKEISVDQSHLQSASTALPSDASNKTPPLPDTTPNLQHTTPNLQHTTPNLTTSTSKQSGMFWWLWGKKPAVVENPATTVKSAHVCDSQDTIHQETNEHLNEPSSLSTAGLNHGSDAAALEEKDFIPDPKVVDFFQTFPEYYREKAIRRFSSRKGLMRFEIYRDFCMQDERVKALRGEFPEARRERQAAQAAQEEMMRAERYEDFLEEARNRREEEGVPEWEKMFLRYIPLQEGETMARKLYHSVLLSTIGFSCLYLGFTYKKRYPNKNYGIGKWRLVASGAVGIAGMICFQYFTLLRLYDFGYFDLSVDKRNFMEKIQDKAEKDAEEYFEVFLDFIDPPKEKDDKS